MPSPFNGISMSKKFYSLIIMDGFGIAEKSKGNAITLAGTPHIKALAEKYPHTQLGASGMNVGLPDGQMGNSEVGHLNMGAGRIVYQELTRITKAIRDGEFFENPALLKAINNAKNQNKALHIMGLVSNGGVHSHNTHLYALLDLAKRHNLEKVYVHCFMDGRDVSPTSGIDFIRELQQIMAEKGVGEIATITGRYYAMDRDFAWDRNKKAYDMMTVGEGLKFDDPVQCMQDSYDRGVTDEFVLPSVICKNGNPVGLVEKGDSMIFFNFRPDRARQITRSFIYEDFNNFSRETGWLNPVYVAFTQYDVNFNDYLDVAFKPTSMNNTFGEYVSRLGYKQLRIAETQKYAHVTFFFNGGVEKPNDGEDRILIPSPDVPTFDLKPSMSACEVTEEAIKQIKSGKYDVMILNYANCDMVGHTGIIPAAVEAVCTVDDCVAKLISAIREIGGMAIVTADHGNADEMLDEEGNVFTAHSTNPVPFILVDDDYVGKELRSDGVLADVIPTLLSVMGEKIPEEMTGKTLIK